MSHCDLAFQRTYLKCTGLMNEVLPIYNPSFAEICWKIIEKMVYSWFEIAEKVFSILCPCDLDLWTAHLKMYTALLHVIIYIHLRRIGRKKPEKSCNASRTHFQRLSPLDLDLCSMAPQMHMYTTFANVYTPAKFHHERMKNDREIATTVFSFLCPCDLDLWLFYSKMYTALLPVIIYHLAKFEKDWMINGREIV